ncbi:MAG: ribosome maturation factor RimP [Christensenellaceae bacterium]|nr:ribosome maturation factor RimP [Christensenellaceae bacterium]
MSKVAEKVSEHIKPIVEDLGYELVEVEYKKRNDGMNLTVTIANEREIGIEDCEKVHLAIDGVLDDLDPTNGETYRLNVSSPGLDRKFKTTRDYERSLGREIVVKLYTPIEGSKEFVGVLKEVTGIEITLETENKIMVFERSQIASSQPYIKF